MICLLDINVLIALVDPNHEFHQKVRAWFISGDLDVWTTCPLTENGVIRILGQGAYTNFSGGPAEARDLVKLLVNSPRHQFWADEISICDGKQFPKLGASKHLTDMYLLGLALHHSAKLATLDQKIDPDLVPRGGEGLLIIS